MTALKTDPESSEFQRAFDDLVHERRAGHMGRYCFSGPLHESDPVRGNWHWTCFIKTSLAYYPYHHVIKIIRHAAGEICRRVADAGIYVDLGTGSLDSFEGKTLPILREGSFAELIFVDLCSSFSSIAADRLKRENLPIQVNSLKGNFFEEPLAFSCKAVISLFGITLGNIIVDLPNETPEQVLIKTMKHFSAAMAKHGGYFIFDYDTNNDEPSIHKAYDHPAYHAMEMTILDRVKRDIPTENFTPDDFRHVTAWYSQWGLLAQELMAKRDIRFNLAGHTVKIPAGKSLHTGNSFKYSDEMVERCAHQAGFESVHVISIPDSPMRVAVATVRQATGHVRTAVPE